MPARLIALYPPGARVEIRFANDDNAAWQPAIVLRHEPPGMWVAAADGHRWFVTNTKRVRNAGMSETVAAQLLTLNRAFYERMAAEFAQSRRQPWPGFQELIPWLPTEKCDLLDVGCGSGRLGGFFWREARLRSYTGVDFSEPLLRIARVENAGTFAQRDLSQPDCLHGLGDYDAIACLATMQHIPGRANRLRLLREMADHLRPGGRLFLAHWQFARNPRQQRKVNDWESIGLSAVDVEPRDYLLSWRRGGFAWRYVCLIDPAEMAALAQEAGLTILHQFHSDGREGDLNLYAVLQTA